MATTVASGSSPLVAADAHAPVERAEATDEAHALQEANALLRRIGFGARQFARFEDLVASASSMSVALYEKLFQLRLGRVERAPRSLAHYEANAQLVLDALGVALWESPPAAAALDVGLDGVTGAALCAGDVRAIRQVVRMFDHVLSLLAASNAEPLPARAKKMKTGVRKARKPTRVLQRTHSSSEESDRERAPRPTHRTAQRQNASSADAGALRHALPQQEQAQQAQQARGDINLYETSDGRRGAQDAAVTDHSSLLETQKYGRFVPVASSRSLRQNSVGRNASSDSDASDLDGVAHRGDGAATSRDGERQMYFGGVSSVSNGSGADESVHFLEEDDDASRDFSSSNIIDLQNVPPPNARSPSNANDRRRSFARSHRAATESKSVLQQQSTRTKARNPNQEEEEEEDEAEQARAPTEKPSLSSDKATPTSACDPPTRAVARERDLSTALYPLLPKTSAATSKSQAEFTRYKLYLKDHLQELRQREFCQRQHLERAYKVGEHTANVEKIRARRFQQDVRLQRIAIGLEAKNEEEKHLRHTLTHILALEKAKLRDEHRTTSSILKQIQKDHHEREAAVETFYANQIELVKERTHREVRERELVEKAHRLASEQMLREMRREREHQVASLLQEKQHLEEARRFRAAATLSSALERGDDARARASQARVDAFYTAAMKARQHNARRGDAAAAARKGAKQTAAAFSSVRPAPAAARRVR